MPIVKFKLQLDYKPSKNSLKPIKKCRIATNWTKASQMSRLSPNSAQYAWQLARASRYGCASSIMPAKPVTSVSTCERSTLLSRVSRMLMPHQLRQSLTINKRFWWQMMSPCMRLSIKVWAGLSRKLPRRSIAIWTVLGIMIRCILGRAMRRRCCSIRAGKRPISKPGTIPNPNRGKNSISSSQHRYSLTTIC